MWESCQWLVAKRWFSPGFLHYLQLASHELATIGINVTKNKIQIPLSYILSLNPSVRFASTRT